MNRIYYYLQIGIAGMIGILALFAFIRGFYPIKIFDIQFMALLQRIVIDFSLFAGILFAVLLIFTFLFGRIYCSTICPLGIYQAFLMLIFRRQITVQKSWPYKYFLTAIVLGTFLGGTIFFVRLTDPYTLFSSALSGISFGLTVLILLIILVWFKGRFFCAHICPVGVILGLISKRALNQIYIEKDKCISCGLCAMRCPVGCIDLKNKTVDNETCVKCFKCLKNCRFNNIHYGRLPAVNVPFSFYRRRLLMSGALIGVFTIAVKSGFEFRKNITDKIKKIILPPGAKNAQDFANRCLNCNLCVQSCPMKILKKANENYTAIHIDYGNNFCDYDCNKCSQVCPSGALKRLDLAEKQKTQIGIAVINKEKCVQCGLCVMKCPRQIISKKENDYPLIQAHKCIGCGTCQSGCPVKAITVKAVQEQKIL